MRRRAVISSVSVCMYVYDRGVLLFFMNLSAIAMADNVRLSAGRIRRA